MSYEIEKEVPIPTRKKEAKYPFKILEIDESFLIKKEEVESKSSYQNFASNIHCMAKAAGIKISIRKLDNGDVRIWRIE